MLAISSTAYDVIISPKAIVEKQDELDKKKAEAEEKQTPTTPPASMTRMWRTWWSLAWPPSWGLDETELREKCQDTNSQYKRLAQKVDADVEEQIRNYIDENDLTGCIYLQPDTKRYYPYSTLASQIIGFTNDNGGAYGLEATFDDDLTGKDGLVVTAKNANGVDLMNFFQDYYDPEPGSDLHLTLDANIQTSVRAPWPRALSATMCWRAALSSPWTATPGLSWAWPAPPAMT